MVRCEAIKDASFLWWTLRPSIRYSPLDLRIADSCTRLEDTLPIAAMYRCLVRLLVRRPEINRGLTGASRAIASENLWRVQRHGIGAAFIDETRGIAVPCTDYLANVLDLVAEDADALGSAFEVRRAQEIVAGGTSADRQIAIFEQRAPEVRNAEALAAVVDWLAETTCGAP